jgi:hypothetical protein
MTNITQTPSPQRKRLSEPIRVLSILAVIAAIGWGVILAVGYFTDTTARRTALYEAEKTHCSKPNVVFDRGGVFPLDYGRMTKPADSNYDEMVQQALRPHTKYMFSCSSSPSIF